MCPEKDHVDIIELLASKCDFDQGTSVFKKPLDLKTFCLMQEKNWSISGS